MSLTLEHVRRKSPEKPRRRVKFSNENTKDLQPSARKKVRKLTTKQKLIKQSFELRKKFEELSSEWQEKLFDTVDINVLRES
ncbi:1848_t:CDS:1, partial [Funneliformis caledonium]